MRKATIIKTLKSLGVNDEYEINSPHEIEVMIHDEKPANYSKTAHKVDVWGIDTATHKQKAPSTITIESKTRQKLIPKEKIYNGHVYVLIGTSDNTFNAKDIKKAADRKQKGTKFPKKSKIVKIQSGQYRLFGVYQEKF